MIVLAGAVVLALEHVGVERGRAGPPCRSSCAGSASSSRLRARAAGHRHARDGGGAAFGRRHRAVSRSGACSRWSTSTPRRSASSRLARLHARLPGGAARPLSAPLRGSVLACSASCSSRWGSASSSTGRTCPGASCSPTWGSRRRSGRCSVALVRSVGARRLRSCRAARRLKRWPTSFESTGGRSSPGPC